MNQTNRKDARWLLLAAGGVCAAAVLALSGGFTSAQTPDSTPTPPTDSTPGQTPGTTSGTPTYEDLLAEELDIGVEELRQAQSTARDRYFDALVDSGALTQEQAANLKATSSGEIISRTMDSGIGMLRGVALSILAGAMDMDRQELEQGLNEGKSLDEIAEEQGIDTNDVRAEIESAADDLIGMIQNAGLIDQQQAADLRQTIDRVIDDLFGELGGSGAGTPSTEPTNTPTP